MDAEPTDPRSCPVCGKPREERYRPFCSKRCADVDLGRWLGGVYKIEASDDDEDEMVDAPVTPKR
jgi:endogenous inhibitor of DNA gyrase (YacG/DUF329 family)